MDKFEININSNDIKRTVFTVIFIIILINLTIFTLNFLYISKNTGTYIQTNNTNVKDVLPQSETVHTNITILSNSELEAYPYKIGSGTEEDPFIIQNLMIMSSLGINQLVYITNIDAYHLILRNLTIIGNSSANVYGIYLKDSGNITVENCVIKELNSISFSVYAIYIYGCDYITIKDTIIEDINSINENNNYGIGIYKSYNIFILNNRIRNIEVNSDKFYGIYITTSEYITYENNSMTSIEVLEKFYGVYLYNYINYSNFFNNIMSDIKANYTYGFNLQVNSTYNTFINNSLINIISKSKTIIFLMSAHSNNNKFYSNEFLNCYSETELTGFYTSIFSTGNIFSKNIMGEADFYVKDQCTGNYWYDYTYFEASKSDRMVGNYYLNYSGSDLNCDFIGDTPMNLTYDSYIQIDPFPIIYNGLDSDDDGLINYDEINKYNTNPNVKDTDQDGLSDYVEVILLNTDPNTQDSDGDGILDPIDSEPNNPNYASPLTDYIMSNYISALIIAISLGIFSIFLIIRVNKKSEPEQSKLPKKSKNK